MDNMDIKNPIYSVCRPLDNNFCFIWEPFNNCLRLNSVTILSTDAFDCKSDHQPIGNLVNETAAFIRNLIDGDVRWLIYLVSYQQILFYFTPPSFPLYLQQYHKLIYSFCHEIFTFVLLHEFYSFQFTENDLKIYLNKMQRVLQNILKYENIFDFTNTSLKIITFST
jgi:hypothetical protein